MFISKKISFKIMSLMIMVILFLAVSIGFYSFTNFEKSVRENKSEILVNIVTNLKGNISSKIDGIGLVSTNINGLSGVRNYFSNNSNFISAQNELKEFDKGITEISEGIFITNKNGEIVLDSKDGSMIGINVKDRDYFSQTKNGEMVLSNPVESKSTGNLVLVHARPYIINDEIKGMVGITVKFDYITNLVDEIKVGENGYAYMLNGEGLALAHPIKEKVLVENIGETGIPELTKQVIKMTSG